MVCCFNIFVSPCLLFYFMYILLSLFGLMSSLFALMSSYDYIVKIIEPRVEDNCYICLGIFW